MNIRTQRGRLGLKLRDSLQRGLRFAVPLAASFLASSSLQAGVLQDDFSDGTGRALGRAKVDEGILKLVDLADLGAGGGLPLQGSYVFEDIDGGQPVASFNAKFKARIGGGTERPAQGFSFVFAEDISTRTTPFREAGGGSQGLIVSFDTVNNVIVPGVSSVAEGNPLDEAPGIIVYFLGTRVASKKMNVRTGDAFVDVEVAIRPDGTLDLKYGAEQVFSGEGIGYIPIAGSFGFGAGTEEVTSANRDNHWIDDLNINTAIAGGTRVARYSPAPGNARPDAIVRLELTGGAIGAVGLKFDGQVVTPVVTAGDPTIVSYDPPGLLAQGSSHSVELTYGQAQSLRYSFGVIRYPVIPGSGAVAAVNTSSGGFRVRTHQTTETQANTYERAESQLAGELGDNIADLSAAESDGTFKPAVLNFEQFAADVPGESFALNELFPGITDATGSTDNIAIEARGYLQLEAGVIYRLGAMSDDGTVVRIGSDPRDVTASTELFRASDGVSSRTFAVEKSGFYPVRLVWWEAGGRAHLEFWSENAAGERTLINDPNDAASLKIYRSLPSAVPNTPYVSQTLPVPNAVGVEVRPNIELTLTDSDTTVSAASIVLKLNGSVVTPAVSPAGSKTRLSFRPAADLAANALQTVELTFRDSANNSVVRSWSFTTGESACEAVASGTVIAGYWDFNHGDLRGRIGPALQFKDASVADQYVFGMTGEGDLADVAPINGKPAKVLGIPFSSDVEMERKLGLLMEHRIAPNGGGTLVNQWTLIVDLLWQDKGRGFGSILRTHDLDANLDGDLFWRRSDGSYGKGCCSSYDGISQQAGHNQPNDTWARLVISVDLAASPRTFSKYVNGFLHRSDVTGDANGLDSRFALPSKILLFNDGDDNEQSAVFISAIQMRAGAMTPAEVAALGGPSADGIPGPYSQWDFDGGNLDATLGQALEFKDPSVADHYLFGTTGEGDLADIPGINGEAAKILAIPFTTDVEMERKLGLLLEHGLAANGGGQSLNQWTLVADLMWKDNGRGFGSILRTHDLDGNLDGDLFWRRSDGSYGKGCCSSYDGISQQPGFNQPNETWARLVISVDLAASPRTFAKYINGHLHRSDVTGDANGLDSRFALPPKILMFNDGDDNEQSSVYINSIQIRPGAISATEAAALGGPSAKGIPAPTPGPVKGQWDFDDGTLAGVLGQDLRFKDESVFSHYSYGAAGEGDLADLPLVNGQAAKVLSIPFTSDTALERQLGLLMQHGIAPNGGGQLVNQWTLIADLLWRDNGRGFGAILRTHDLDGNLDGDLFWRRSDGSYGKGCCSSYDGISQEAGRNQPNDTWARLVISVDLAASPRTFAKYINGHLHRNDVTGDANGLDSRFALPSQILLFNDGDDNEQSSVFVNSLQIREGSMTAEEVAALGGPSATGIPYAVVGKGSCQQDTERPVLHIELFGAQARLSWDSRFSGFTLESKSAVGDAAWTAVAGVQNNAVAVPVGGTVARFYRIRK